MENNIYNQEDENKSNQGFDNSQINEHNSRLLEDFDGYSKEQESKEFESKKKYVKRRTEGRLWILLFFINLLYISIGIYWDKSLNNSINFETLINQHSVSLVSCFVLFFFPNFFNLTFEKLPFEYFSQFILSKNIKQRPNEINQVINNYNNHFDNNILKADKITLPHFVHLNQLILESKKISDGVSSNSKGYLFIGGIIAISGIIIFYFPFLYINEIPAANTNTKFYSEILKYIPRVGALFFVEFIAFFFLRQFRVMMEEYRYYEAIKRKRQDELTIIYLVESYSENPELLKIIIDNIHKNEVKKMSNGETTEILETQKIVNQDFDIFGKFTDLINAIKSK